MNIEKIEDEALRLPKDERAKLADQLLSSLEQTDKSMLDLPPYSLSVYQEHFSRDHVIDQWDRVMRLML